MYRIAICDDDEAYMGRLASLAAGILDEIGLKSGSDYDVDLFSRPEELRRAVFDNKDKYRLLLLDVELPGINGMELAKLFRDDRVGCSLVYISSHRDYIYDCFETQPLWYFVKPVDEERLAGVIRRDYRQRYQDTRLVLKVEGRQVVILHSDIYALEATQHRTRIWLAGETMDWNGPLSAVRPRLPSWRFCQCHNSYLINFSHVTELLRTDVKMDNGMKFPVSRRLYQETMESYFVYLKI